MIDSHCHLDHEPLFEDLENVIKRSKEVGLEKILTICTTLNSFTNILKIICRIYLYKNLIFLIFLSDHSHSCCAGS